MIDSDGYRANIGIVITNDKKQILLAKRFKQSGWQLPQGGIDEDETELDALYRELQEEVGLDSSHVTLIAKLQSGSDMNFQMSTSEELKNLCVLVKNKSGIC